MTREKKWQIATVALVVGVVILLLLLNRQKANAPLPARATINPPGFGDVLYDLNLTINYPEGETTETGGGGCGCADFNVEIVNDALAYFVNGMRQIQDDYLAYVMGQRPDWALQYWNNATGYNYSLASRNAFGNSRGY